MCVCYYLCYVFVDFILFQFYINLIGMLGRDYSFYFTFEKQKVLRVESFKL